MKLYSYWRSTTSYRVRAALKLKGLSYETVPVDLVSGAQAEAEYLDLNPSAGVPTLILEDGTVLTQSLAIIDYLDSIASPRLVPSDPLLRAKVLAVAHAVAMDIHPVNNLRVIQKLELDFNAEAQPWMQHWMKQGFTAIEAMLDPATEFALTGAPSLADICITAQVYNAHRWDVDLDAFPIIKRVEAACLALPEFRAAHPDQQPDAMVTT